MNNTNWNNMNPLQLGKYAEFLVKMEFASYGFNIYSSEVDDHGVDFIIKLKNNFKNEYFEIQVKSIRKSKYIFFPKNKFKPRNNLLAAIIIFNKSELKMYLIPSKAWNFPNKLLVNRKYVNKASKPEYGINLSKKNEIKLNKYDFYKVIKEKWPLLSQ